MTPAHPGRRGEAVLDLVDVMDRLRSPGGCPWDAEQTHASLAPYAVEEAYELAEAIENGDLGDVVDELGDVLLQVVFHARVGQDGDEPFDIDDVARAIIGKLQRRHPHVFADVAVTGAADVEANWDAIKAAEKPDRTGPLDGIPAGMPPLERATKVVSRLDRAGLLPPEPATDARAVDGSDGTNGTGTNDTGIGTGTNGTGIGAGIGDRLRALVVEARAAGVDPAAELRGAVGRLEQHVQRVT